MYSRVRASRSSGQVKVTAARTQKVRMVQFSFKSFILTFMNTNLLPAAILRLHDRPAEVPVFAGKIV